MSGAAVPSSPPPVPLHEPRGEALPWAPRRRPRTGPAVVYGRRRDRAGGFTHVDETVTAVLGWKPRDFTDNPAFWESLLHPHDAPRVRAVLAALPERRRDVQEYRLRHADGTYRWVRDELLLTADSEAARSEIVGAWLDITEIKRAEQTARVLASTARSLLGTLDLERVARRIAQAVQLLLGAEAAAVYRLGPSGELVSLAVWGAAQRVLGGRVVVPAGAGVVGLAVREARVVTTPNLLADPRVTLPPELRERLERAPYRAALALPLTVGGRVIGALAVADRAGRQFDADEIYLARVFAAQAALALDRARIHEESEQRRREAELHAELVGSIVASLDLDTVLARVAAAARELTRSDMAAIVVREPGAGRFTLRHGQGLRGDYVGAARVPGWGLLARVLATGRPARTVDYGRDAELERPDLDLARAEGMVAGLAVPIRRTASVDGAVLVANRSARAFSERDESVLLRLAGHAAVALGNAELFAQERAARAAAEEVASRLEALSRRLVAIQELERRALARELHDEIGQALTALKINLQTLERRPLQRAVPPTARLADSIAIVGRLLQQVRDMSLSLRPAILDDLGLVAAVRWYVDTQARRAGFAARVVADAPDERYPPEVAITCFRVVQEAVTNAIRHARARELTVELARRGDELEVVVRDDGVGFDVGQALARAARGESLGLLGIEERVRLLRGRLEIVSAPGRGTEVRARVPLTPAPGARGERA